VPSFDRRELAAIFAGGFFGAVGRGLLAETVPHTSDTWPWATFLVNIAGAALLGYFLTRLQERLPLSAYRRPLLGTGFCGALTTFSTMQLELVKMLDVHAYGLAVAYMVASLVLGYAAVFLATALTRRARVLT
jgi:CrcB protein